MKKLFLMALVLVGVTFLLVGSVGATLVKEEVQSGSKNGASYSQRFRQETRNAPISWETRHLLARFTLQTSLPPDYCDPFQYAEIRYAHAFPNQQNPSSPANRIVFNSSVKNTSHYALTYVGPAYQYITALNLEIEVSHTTYFWMLQGESIERSHAYQWKTVVFLKEPY